MSVVFRWVFELWEGNPYSWNLNLIFDAETVMFYWFYDLSIESLAGCVCWTGVASDTVGLPYSFAIEWPDGNYNEMFVIGVSWWIWALFVKFKVDRVEFYYPE